MDQNISILDEDDPLKIKNYFPHPLVDPIDGYIKSDVYGDTVNSFIKEFKQLNDEPFPDDNFKFFGENGVKAFIFAMRNKDTYKNVFSLELSKFPYIGYMVKGASLFGKNKIVYSYDIIESYTAMRMLMVNVLQNSFFKNNKKQDLLNAIRNYSGIDIKGLFSSMNVNLEYNTTKLSSYVDQHLKNYSFLDSKLEELISLSLKNIVGNANNDDDNKQLFNLRKSIAQSRELLENNNVNLRNHIIESCLKKWINIYEWYFYKIFIMIKYISLFEKSALIFRQSFLKYKDHPDLPLIINSFKKLKEKTFNNLDINFTGSDITLFLFSNELENDEYNLCTNTSGLFEFISSKIFLDVGFKKIFTVEFFLSNDGYGEYFKEIENNSHVFTSNIEIFPREVILSKYKDCCKNHIELYLKSLEDVGLCIEAFWSFDKSNTDDNNNNNNKIDNNSQDWKIFFIDIIRNISLNKGDAKIRNNYLIEYGKKIDDLKLFYSEVMNDNNNNNNLFENQDDLENEIEFEKNMMFNTYNLITKNGGILPEDFIFDNNKKEDDGNLNYKIKEEDNNDDEEEENIKYNDDIIKSIRESKYFKIVEENKNKNDDDDDEEFNKINETFKYLKKEVHFGFDEENKDSDNFNIIDTLKNHHCFINKNPKIDNSDCEDCVDHNDEDNENNNGDNSIFLSEQNYKTVFPNIFGNNMKSFGFSDNNKKPEKITIDIIDDNDLEFKESNEIKIIDKKNDDDKLKIEIINDDHIEKNDNKSKIEIINDDNIKKNDDESKIEIINGDDVVGKNDNESKIEIINGDDVVGKNDNESKIEIINSDDVVGKNDNESKIEITNNNINKNNNETEVFDLEKKKEEIYDNIINDDIL